MHPKQIKQKQNKENENNIQKHEAITYDPSK